MIDIIFAGAAEDDPVGAESDPAGPALSPVAPLRRTSLWWGLVAALALMACLERALFARRWVV